MRSSSLVTLAFVIFTAPALGSTPLCGLTIAALRANAPQIVAVTGTHAFNTMTFRAWPRKRADGDQSEDRFKHGSVHVGAFYADHLLHYGRNLRGLPSTDDDADGLKAGLKWLIQELVNNASYHGNAGNPEELFHVELRLEGDDALLRISDRGPFFDITPFTIEREMTPEQICAAYEMGADGSGCLGLSFALPGYIERYGFSVRSEPRDDGDGIPRTDVLVQIPLARALKTKR